MVVKVEKIEGVLNVIWPHGYTGLVIGVEKSSFRLEGPESIKLYGKQVLRLGVVEGNGLNGHSVIMRLDGSELFEGTFKNGQKSGFGRLIKKAGSSGYATVREGNYVDDMPTGTFKQTKILVNGAVDLPQRIESTYEVEDYSFKAEQNVTCKVSKDDQVNEFEIKWVAR